MHVDTVELVCRETYATHKPGVGFLTPDDATGIFDPITDDQMTIKIMRRFRAIAAPLADEMATWSMNPTKLKGTAVQDWVDLVATPEQKIVFLRWRKAQSLQNSQTVKGGMEAIRGAAFTAEALDAKHTMLGTPKGVLNLTTGQILEPLDAVDCLVTKRTAVDPAPWGDRNESMMAAIESAIPADQIDYLRWHLARGLVAEMGRKAFVHVGSGANGKSMILGLIHAALGEYSVQIDSKALTGNTAEYHVAMLRGARMAYMEELETETSINSSVWKMLVATPTVSARPIREAPISFPATWTVHICSNTMPSVDTGDGGAARRAQIVNWPHKYVKDPRASHERPITIRDPAAWQDHPGNQASVLRWLLDVVNEPEPALPDSLADEFAVWSADNNKVGTFVREMCVYDAEAEVSMKDLQSQYETWLFTNGFAKPNRFTREKVISAWAQNERGVQKVRHSSGYAFIGITMKARPVFVPESAEVSRATPVAVQAELSMLDWPIEEPEDDG